MGGGEWYSVCHVKYQGIVCFSVYYCRWSFASSTWAVSGCIQCFMLNDRRLNVDGEGCCLGFVSWN